MILATFNVNSVKARLPNLLAWLQERKPDVACLQEIKCQDQAFPAMEIEELGYNLAVHGQKTYNGVAILSKHRLEDVRTGLPGNAGDDQARYVEAVTGGVRVGCLYAPNGNPAPGPKFDYKLAWYERLIAHAKELLTLEEPLALAGDFNVIPEEQDCYNPDNWRDDALFRLEAREKLRELAYLGFTDALRALKPVGHDYTFWDYQSGAWAKDNGLRIDHLLLSPQAADKLRLCRLDKMMRAKQKASDHVPIWVELKP
jgi:exodeoxyribonuclease III